MTSVLIVDDDATFRTTIGRDLGAQGFSVVLAEDATEATAALTRTPIDVLLTDLRMPRHDGIDLLERARALAPRARAILMSGFATARDYQRAIEYGAVRVLCKPFTSGELLQAIRLAVDCESGFRGSIHGLSLIDLLQMFNFARRSLGIVIDGTSHVFMQDGSIVHATHGDAVGEAALRELLARPQGSLRTVPFPDGTPRSITRDFAPLLLDALRVVDEEQHGAISEVAFDLARTPSERPKPSEIESIASRLRMIDGYIGVFLVDASNGALLASDGSMPGIDLARAASGYAEIFRVERAALSAMSIDDSVESVLFTFGRQHHVISPIGDPPILSCAIIDRRSGSLGLLHHAMSSLASSGRRGTC